MNELSEAELDALTDQATVDCYNEDEELAGFAVMIEDNLAVPFETTVLCVTVTVKQIDQAESGIVAICVRGKHRQASALLREPDLLQRIRSDPQARSLCIHCNKCMPTIYSGTHCVLATSRRT